MKNETLKRVLGTAALTIALSACGHGVHKADISASAVPSDEINSLDADINASLSNQYDVLDSKDVAKAQSYLSKAQRQMRDGDGQSKILDSVAYGRAFLNRAKDVSEGRAAQVQGILDARKAAIDAGARQFPPQQARLKELDNKFRDISDDKHIPVDTFNKLQSNYMDLELGAIQSTQLDQARAQINGAIKNGAERNTPQILKQAELDMTNANNVITANRHNPEGYQAAVEKANGTAQLLTDVLAATKRGGSVLSEAAALDMVKQQRQIAGLKSELDQAAADKEALGNQVSQANQQLTAAERQQRLDAALEAARKDFDKNEAEVYRQGDKLLIRLKQMNFATGRSDLPSAALPLLAKVKGIAQELKPQQVVVEGHTDSTGDRSVNLELSQNRAQAVAQYLGTGGIDSEKIQAVGEGYKKPIATNKTKAGRAKNRRVDVIITPEGAMSRQ